ncbi:phosphoglycerate mutase (2,3-diphosphoglycerate-independent) [Gilvibacter sp. SZ-19]|uniref:2,3-bisphosphoglycerate-independent phosphoglycerate mutase n=1 Tax=Gilvibacter sp. SZ-19 TaxID=754429 RepID=UPI000B3C49EC|nr:2,3-bisphosphoglycerate-independent phosphoglycerate mutase [Gilvibacter sp. SZ-19]ARV11326.1 phosphoglycerate mutase (2,3-diphosphoglycerate-independent) [Gilvibacter sp. SZ-19]
MSKQVLLMILDGWGMTQDPMVSAIAQANTPFVDSLATNYPHAQLRTDGMHVGLPEGQMGNSEVGHMNLGAGRIVYQDLAKINKAVKEGTLAQEPVLQEAFNYAKNENRAVHLLGLVSDGGVHSHINHLKGLLNVAEDHGLSKVYVHAFTDGRDVDPKSGKGFLTQLKKHLKESTGELASVIGRYYAMDRDTRWERVKKAYDLLVHGKGTPSNDIVASMQESYDNDITDEFIEPICMTKNGAPVATIKDGDVVLFFNFRTDRGRQLTQALSQQAFPEQEMKPLKLHYVTLTNYDDSFQGVKVVYDKENLNDTLGEVLEKAGKTQIRIAETEKYPHVTFFFSGGRETPFEGEKRILCPSPKVATYDLKPEMSAFEIRDKIIPEIANKTADFICLNFANPDMVGHTGVFEAAVKACETVDNCAAAIVQAALKEDYDILIIADHGNSETMINPDGSPHTAHTTNPVPLYWVTNEPASIANGILADVAPTILALMGVSIPQAMTGKILTH